MSANRLHWIRWRWVAEARVHQSAAFQFARDLVKIQESIVAEAMGNVGKRTPSDAILLPKVDDGFGGSVTLPVHTEPDVRQTSSCWGSDNFLGNISVITN